MSACHPKCFGRTPAECDNSDPGTIAWEPICFEADYNALAKSLLIRGMC